MTEDSKAHRRFPSTADFSARHKAFRALQEAVIGIGSILIGDGAKDLDRRTGPKCRRKELDDGAPRPTRRTQFCIGRRSTDTTDWGALPRKSSRLARGVAEGLRKDTAHHADSDRLSTGYCGTGVGHNGSLPSVAAEEEIPVTVKMQSEGIEAMYADGFDCNPCNARGRIDVNKIYRAMERVRREELKGQAPAPRGARFRRGAYWGGTTSVDNERSGRDRRKDDRA